PEVISDLRHRRFRADPQLAAAFDDDRCSDPWAVVDIAAGEPSQRGVWREKLRAGALADEAQRTPAEAGDRTLGAFKHQGELVERWVGSAEDFAAPRLQRRRLTA